MKKLSDGTEQTANWLRRKGVLAGRPLWGNKHRVVEKMAVFFFVLAKKVVSLQVEKLSLWMNL